jgi:phenylpropionate dioxygenase-like ring-hydroxylating dioxygenase large terminal subunit
MIWQRIHETLDFMERNTCFAFIGSAFSWWRSWDAPKNKLKFWYLSLHSRIMWTLGVIWTHREKEKFGTKVFFFVPMHKRLISGIHCALFILRMFWHRIGETLSLMCKNPVCKYVLVHTNN